VVQRPHTTGHMATPPSIAILKPGTFTDVRGTRVTFSRADLAEIAASYDAAADPAPLVVGHPTIDAPAYGWVGRVELVGDELRAHPSEIAPAFAEAVAAGHYRKVSPQLYPPRHPGNPTPGRWHLQHVGFLGGAAPAIKGLGTVAFSEAADAAAIAVTIEQEPPMTDTPDTIALAQREAAATTREAELAGREAAIQAREEAAATAARTAQHDQNVAFAEGLVTAGTLAPAARATVIGLMDQLDASTPVSFGEGDGATSATPLAAFRALFDAAHPVVAFGEHAPASDALKQPQVVLSFAAPAGYQVAPDSAALHARARALQAADPTLSFWDAFNRARAEPAA